MTTRSWDPDPMSVPLVRRRIWWRYRLMQVAPNFLLTLFILLTAIWLLIFARNTAQYLVKPCTEGLVRIMKSDSFFAPINSPVEFGIFVAFYVVVMIIVAIPGHHFLLVGIGFFFIAVWIGHCYSTWITVRVTLGQKQYYTFFEKYQLETKRAVWQEIAKGAKLKFLLLDQNLEFLILDYVDSF